MADWDQYGVQRRVAGKHDMRLEGVSDILTHAAGKTVLDLGCNRGMVCMEFARHNARVLHGCDYSESAIETARSIFADCRFVRDYKFEVCNLTGGMASLREAFGPHLHYDIILMLATLHKLRAQKMQNQEVLEFLLRLARHTDRFFVWRGTEFQEEKNAEELELLDEAMSEGGLLRIHTSFISELGPAAIWRRK